VGLIDKIDKLLSKVVKATWDSVPEFNKADVDTLKQCKAELSGGWISVEDRLPEPKNISKTVLVNVNGSGVRFDVFVKASNQFHKYYGYVTHWQELPPIPQEIQQ